ncbi:MAG: hydrogenobyrinic acid a,c-diamide synthase (glutamine-hydrolyzing) [Deltaproteobacteria bacterium]|nr:hydrogenobyrinic acid a,c-diamide synthase (glutamine-hydrolyzing) [Deltaproteobacteria bacterium]
MKMFDKPRLILAGLRGGSGKTFLTLGLIAAWREMGYDVAPFKKGPDFIDAGWHSFAAGRQCYNLDSFLMTHEQILSSFASRSRGADISLIEGNRGLYDGLDIHGRCSTAELAKVLKAPVILIVDVSMATRTIAAIVKGCQAFDPDLTIAGVILNRAAGPRQIALITGAIQEYCQIPVLGVIPKLAGNIFPERHMGLVPYQERDHSEKAIRWARDAVHEHLEMDSILKLARKVEPLAVPSSGIFPKELSTLQGDSPRIGYILDRSFWFYYPENLEQLERLGATLVKVDAVSDPCLPDLDALYIGGGFPETQAELLAGNAGFRHSLKESINQGLPVYAECGGLMYLGETLVVDQRSYPMVGALPIQFLLEKKPQGHGYTVMRVTAPNPFYPIGKSLRGHEFHYSRAVLMSEEDLHFAFRVERGHGVDGVHDGIVKHNLLATYTHIHGAGDPTWARTFCGAALKRKIEKIHK